VQRYDAAVVGGGLLGCAAAYHLARAGTSVVLLERGQLNRQASGQNAGTLHFQLESRMVEYGDTLAEQFALSLPLVLDAQQAWRTLEAELGEELEVAQPGGLMLAETEEHQALLERKHALEHRWGLETQLLTGDEARALAPYLAPSVRAAGWCATEGHANPRLIGPAYARAATRAGGEIRTEAEVASLARSGGRWRVGVARGDDVEAETVLLAAGAWTPRLAAMADVRLPIVPVALSMIATQRAEPIVAHLIQHVAAKLSMKQAHAGNVLIGGGWASKLVARDGVADLDRRPELRYESLAGNAAVATRVAPGVARLPVIRAWSGIAAVPADQVPLLGPLPRRPGLYVATGGAAFTLGPTFARLAAELILQGRPSLSLDLYDPARFAHLNPV
jgi:sarcosine oxidase subunit beta